MEYLYQNKIAISTHNSAFQEMDNDLKLPLEIARLNRSCREAVFVKLVEYKGTPLIEVRNYWQEIGGNWRPTYKGVSLGLKHLPALANALSQADVKARAIGLLGA